MDSQEIEEDGDVRMEGREKRIGGLERRRISSTKFAKRTG